MKKTLSIITLSLLFFCCCFSQVQSLKNCDIAPLQTFFFQVIKNIGDEAMMNTQPCVAAGEGPGIFTPVGVARALGALGEAVFNVNALTELYVKTSIAPNMFEDRYTSVTCDNLLQQLFLQATRIYNYLLPSSPLPPNEYLKGVSEKLKDPFYFPGNATENIKTLSGDSFELDALLITNLLRENLQKDGSNQEGCYADTTNYFPVNPPTNLTTLQTIQASAAAIRDKTHWSQEVRYPDVTSPRAFQNPSAIKMEPFADIKGGELVLDSFISDEQLHGEMLSLLDYQATMASRIENNRFMCDYWAYDTTNTNSENPNLPFRSQPAAHWVEILFEYVINVLNNETRQCDFNCAIKLLFGVTQATRDAGIAVWTNKRIYDTVRPSTYITSETGFTTPAFNQFRDPWCPFGNIQTYQWQPYQALYFITPAFPGFPSGHSAFAAAAAKVLELVTGSEYFPQPVTPLLKRGRGKFEYQCFANGTNLWGEPCQYQTCRLDPSYDTENHFYPAQDVTLGPFYKYDEMAVSCGYGRLFCGVHILADNLQGLDLGRFVGQRVYEKLESLYEM